MAETALPIKVELSNPKPESAPTRTSTAELKPKLVTPEAKTNAAGMLRSRLTALQQEQAKLANDLEKHNCIKLDRLSFDYGGEITRYQNALQALEQGDTSQAIQLVEKQVVTNMKSQEDLVDSQKQATSEYERVNNKLKSAQSKLKVTPWTRFKYSRMDLLGKYYQQAATQQVDQTHKTDPMWKKSTNSAVRSTEIQSTLSKMMLSTPDYAAEYALAAINDPAQKVSHETLYVWLQREKYLALDTYRNNMNHIVTSHENYTVDNTRLDGLIEDLGGPRQSDWQTIQRRKQMLDEFKAQTATDPDVKYNQILENNHASFDDTEKQLLKTFNQLTEERSAIEIASKSKLPAEERKLLALRRSREALLEYRLQEVWSVHTERRRITGKSGGYPYSEATLADRAAYLRKQEMEQTTSANISSA